MCHPPGHRETTTLAARARGQGFHIARHQLGPGGNVGRGLLPDVLAQTDLPLPNEAEALRIAGTATLPEAIASLTKARGTIAVKLGARGALYADGSQQYVATPPQIAQVDATGAGDCGAGAASTQGIGGTGSSPELTAALALARKVTVRPGPGGSAGRPAGPRRQVRTRDGESTRS